MGDFINLIQKRRSCRKFAEGDISADNVQLILRAALMSPSSRNRQLWEFVVIDDGILLDKLADSKETGAQFLRQSAFAVVVLGNPADNDCWIEDGSIAAYSMQLQAEDLGLGSCWAQMRGRSLSDGTSADDVIHGILEIPAEMKVLCVIGFGQKGNACSLRDEDTLKWENVHINKY